jgi:hypothetical protein
MIDVMQFLVFWALSYVQVVYRFVNPNSSSDDFMVCRRSTRQILDELMIMLPVQNISTILWQRFAV